MDFERKTLKTKKLKHNKGQIEGVPKNPRLIKDERFDKLVKSIAEAPEMLELRELIVYHNGGGEYIVLCGNMRLSALVHLGIKECPCKVLGKDTPKEKLREYSIKDNIEFGDDDWNILGDWNFDELENWGMEFEKTPTIKDELPVEVKKKCMRFYFSQEEFDFVENALSSIDEIKEYAIIKLLRDAE